MPASASKKADTVSLGTPVADAARRLLSTRLGAVPLLLRRAIRAEAGSEPAIKAVHQLRVGCRRAEAAIAAFSDLLDKKPRSRLRRRLKRLRRAAGASRDADVEAAYLGEDAPRLKGELAKAARLLARTTVATRAAGLGELAEIGEKHPKARWVRAERRLIDSIDAGRIGERLIEQLARRVVRQSADDVLAAGEGDLDDLARAHTLRVALKRLRYRIELFRGCLSVEAAGAIRTALQNIQDELGRMSDLDRVVNLCDQGVKDTPADAAMVRLREHYVDKLKAAHADAVAAWRKLSAGPFFADLDRAFSQSSFRSPVPISLPLSAIEPKAGPSGRAGATAPHLNGHAGNGEPVSRRRRIAAIDVGTNSLRLIVAETAADGSYRVLDDEKEVTRLGRGLKATARLDPASIEHSVAAISRMQAIARGYGATEVRVVATAAARDAGNRDDLVAAVRQRTGLEMQVISAEQEAMLAYRSAANAFDLASQPAAVVDLGGGSTEVVLSVGRGRGSSGVGPGVIERIYTIPLGAVGLTEQFGGPEQAGGDRFSELRTHVKSVIRQHFGRRGVPIAPQVVIGTGGTFTTLAAMARQRDRGPDAGGLFDGSVQGCEVTRADTRHLLDYLRKLSVRERARVPGMPADRADIIVAGLTIVDAILKCLGVNGFRAHDGGIRDGLLLAMVRQQDLDARGDARGSAGGGGGGRSERIDPMRAVRRFAKACAYEHAHAAHVAMLSLQIFDQLLPTISKRAASELGPDGLDPARARQLLEAAAILHDVGYLINYNSHHKHSYHLIVHADLPGWTTQEIGVIASVARYHRCAEPKVKHRHFTELDERHRWLVRSLAGMLRVADGLDRTHMQRVTSLALRVHKDAAFFDVAAQEEPSVDIWGAVRKGRLFEQTLGLVPHFEWLKPSAASGKPAPKSVVTAPAARMIGI